MYTRYVLGTLKSIYNSINYRLIAAYDIIKRFLLDRVPEHNIRTYVLERDLL